MPDYEFRVVGIKGRTDLSANHWAEAGSSKTLCGREYEAVLDVPFRTEGNFRDCGKCAHVRHMREQQSKCGHDGPLDGDFCGCCYARVVPNVAEQKPYLTWPEHMKDEVTGARYIRRPER